MQADMRRFSRETLCFLLAACGFAVLLYVHAASLPIPLQHTAAMSTSEGPPPLCVAELPPVKSETHYLEGGRESPFMPYREPRPKPPSGGLVIKERELPRDDSKAASRDGAVVVPADDSTAAKPIAELRFVGTVFAGGHTRGLLQASDDATRLCVKSGDVLSAYGCTVTRIEKQAIHLVNGQRRPIVLTDGRPHGGATTSKVRESRDAKTEPADREQRELPRPHSQAL